MLLYVKQSDFWQKLSRRPFSYEERVTLQSLLWEGYSQKECAEHLKRSPSVISREVNRTKGIYNFKNASIHAKKMRSKRGRKRVLNDEIENQIIKYLYKSFSPSVILKTILIHLKISIQTVYNWIKWKWIDFNYYSLLRPRKRKKKLRKTTNNVIGRSILTRPEEINERKTFGHWELDLIVGGANYKKGYLLVLQERLSRLVIIESLHSKTAYIVNQKISEIISEIGQKHFNTITTDNGNEFYDLYKLEAPFNFLTYYARPYRSGDKGSVENVNSIIRRWLPKGTNLKLIPDIKILEIENWINNLPRKILNWKSAREIFQKFI